MADIPEPVRTGLNSYSTTDCGLAATVFCWSRSEPGSERWIQAETLGAELAKRGISAVTGGYNGSMKAVSKGARLCAERLKAEHREAYPVSPCIMQYEKAPAGDLIKKVEKASYEAKTEIEGKPVEKTDISVRGILVPGQFPDRALTGNEYLTESVDSRSMMHRLDLLTSLTRYYVVLPGTMGTLCELVLIWQNSVLHPKGHDRPLILCYRDPWQKVISTCCETLGISKDFEDAIQYVDSAEEAAEMILNDYKTEEAKKKQ